MAASLPLHAVRRARPRPFLSRWIALTPSRVQARVQAICQLTSVEADEGKLMLDFAVSEARAGDLGLRRSA